jgi:hypothetical protein
VDGGWLDIEGVGGHNTAWINAGLVQLDGNADVMQVPEVNPDIGLSISGFYGPPTVTSVNSSGGEETVEWSMIPVRKDLLPGEGVPIYIVEVWSCKDGKPAFDAYGTNDLTITFPLETGCGPQPRALIRLQFKEGFSKGEAILLPP